MSPFSAHARDVNFFPIMQHGVSFGANFCTAVQGLLVDWITAKKCINRVFLEGRQQNCTLLGQAEQPQQLPICMKTSIFG